MTTRDRRHDRGTVGGVVTAGARPGPGSHPGRARHSTRTGSARRRGTGVRDRPGCGGGARGGRLGYRGVLAPGTEVARGTVLQLSVVVLGTGLSLLALST